MIQLLAQGCILIAAGWLAWVSIVCLVAPQVARNALARFGSTAAMQFGEHIPRAVVGIALIVRAAESKAPAVFAVGGWFLLATSIAIMLAPRRWHHAYAEWWAERIPLWFYRIAAPPTVAFAGMLAYATL
ncbi:hypothetical protein ACI5KX_00505 [Erythrobacter sp. GH1-10]|uniref:hypothetical protein n=1 Tax=Erythrobacter sp. GH1-10 TaxID=3349334 RepID=UPI003877F48D